MTLPKKSKTLKYKIGDKVRLINDDNYGDFVERGGIVTISAAEIDKYGGYQVYGFVEDKEEQGKAQWLYVEDNFELVSAAKRKVVVL